MYIKARSNCVELSFRKQNTNLSTYGQTYIKVYYHVLITKRPWLSGIRLDGCSKHRVQSHYRHILFRFFTGIYCMIKVSALYFFILFHKLGINEYIH